jgi:hypothetical protein
MQIKLDMIADFNSLHSSLWFVSPPNAWNSSQSLECPHIRAKRSQKELDVDG